MQINRSLRTTCCRSLTRVSYSEPPNGAQAPDVHTGDEIVVATQPKQPQVYRDDGAFERRAYLEQQNIDLVATLRAPELVERTAAAPKTPATLLAHARRRLREEIDALFASTPQVAGVLRAMLLGDRSFVDRSESTDFPKAGVFHVLVVAGLHVGALAVFLFYILTTESIWKSAASWHVPIGSEVVLNPRHKTPHQEEQHQQQQKTDSRLVFVVFLVLGERKRSGAAEG